MWRSVAATRTSLYKQVSLKCRTIHSPKVFSNGNPISIPCFSSWVIHKTPIFQNPIFFISLSQYSTTESSVEHIDDSVVDDNFNEQSEKKFNSLSLESENSDSGLVSEQKGENGDTQIDEVNSGSEEECKIDVEKLESLLSLLQSSNVEGSLESGLDGLNLSLHEKFMEKVLETPLILGENLVGYFKWGMKKPDFLVTTRVVEALVRAICKGHRRKEAYAVWDLIKDIGERENGVLNVGILNELIALFSRLGKGKAGFEVFNKFEEFWCVPNEDTYHFTIEALCRRSLFDWASSVCEKMINARCLPDTEKIGKIISMLGKGSRGKDAHLVYMLAKDMKKYPPQSSLNYLIRALCRENVTVQLALGMLEDFSVVSRKHAIKPFSSVISALCRIEDIDGAKKLLAKMISKGPPPGNAVFNYVISALSKAGDMEDAKKMINTMEKRGLKPDVFAYSVIISGYAKGGQMDDACEVLSEAKKKHTKLSSVTYHTLIRGYCKLEEFDNALKLLAEMKDFGVQPNADEYNKLIQSLCLKALDWETAEKLFDEMKENGLHLNGITQGLIRAVKEMVEEGATHSEEVAEA